MLPAKLKSVDSTEPNAYANSMHALAVCAAFCRCVPLRSRADKPAKPLTVSPSTGPTALQQHAPLEARRVGYIPSLAEGCRKSQLTALPSTFTPRLIPCNGVGH